MAVAEFGQPTCTIFIGAMFSTSLLNLSTLFGGVWGGIWIEERCRLIKISTSSEEKKVRNWPSVPTNFFNDCSLDYNGQPSALVQAIGSLWLLHS